jgi:hypothetical protein
LTVRIELTGAVFGDHAEVRRDQFDHAEIRRDQLSVVTNLKCNARLPAVRPQTEVLGEKAHALSAFSFVRRPERRAPPCCPDRGQIEAKALLLAILLAAARNIYNS